MIRLALSLLMLSLASGCVTSPTWHAEPSTPQAIESAIASHAGVKLHMIDKTLIWSTDGVRDFGNVLCVHRLRCVRKPEVVQVEWEQGKPQLLAGEILLSPLYLLAAPIMVPYALALWNAQKDDYKPAQPIAEATPEHVKRQWLDHLSIRDNKVYRGLPNPCLSDGFMPRNLASDAEALDWVWQHRRDGPGECLSFAAEGYAFIGGAESRERAMRLSALGDIRWQWDSLRCLVNYGDVDPVTPPPFLDSAPGRGDPRALDIIEETLADTDAYLTTIDLRAFCRSNPVAPTRYWPQIEAQLRRASPYSKKSPREITPLTIGHEEISRETGLIPEAGVARQ